MKIGETILLSVVTGLAVALILSASSKKEEATNEPGSFAFRPSTPSIIIEEVD